MPKSMECLIITPELSWDGARLKQRDDLNSLCIDRFGSLTLAIPKNVQKTMASQR